MKRLVALLAVSTGLVLSACDDPERSETIETYEPAIEEPVAPAAEEASAPAAATTTDEAPPVDPGALPTDERTSEETVKPESETLFY